PFAPLRAGARPEQFGEALPQAGPARRVVLPGQVLAGQADAFEELRIEARLDRSERDVATIGRLVAVVPGTAAVEQVLATILGPAPARQRAMQEGGQRTR